MHSDYSALYALITQKGGAALHEMPLRFGMDISTNNDGYGEKHRAVMILFVKAGVKCAGRR